MQTIANLASDEAKKLFHFKFSPNGDSVIIDHLHNACNGISVNIPEAIDGVPVTELKLTAYLGFQIHRIRIPKTVLHIDLFNRFPVLRDSLEIDPENPIYTTDGAALIRKSDHNLLVMCTNPDFYAIPDGVEIINSNAFKFCHLTQLHIPDSVHTVGFCAFSGCRKLERITGCRGIVNCDASSFKETDWYRKAGTLIVGKMLLRMNPETDRVVIPEGIEIIAPEALEASYERKAFLEEVVLPASLRKIGDCAFHGNISLSKMVLPEGLEEIGNRAFANCESLRSIRIPRSVKHIGIGAFCRCNELENVELSGVFSGFAKEDIWNKTPVHGVLSANLFDGCIALKEVRIPEGFHTIGVQAFQDTALTKVVLPEGMKELGKQAFSGCFWMEQIYLPKSVSKLGNDVFPTSTTGLFIRQNAVLKQVDVDGENPHFRSVDGILFSEDGELIFCPSCLTLSSFTIPDWTTKIRSGAFRGNSGIARLVIPESLEITQEYPFAEMSALEEVVFLGSRSTLTKGMFQECKKLKRVVWPEQLKAIGYAAFEETSLERIDIPASVETIDAYAFARCKAESVIIPKTVTAIGVSCFAGIRDITVYDNLDSNAKPAEKHTDAVNGKRNGSVGFVGIYQHKGQFSGACNCQWYDHTITVRFSETGAIKHTVRMPDGQKRKVYCTYASSWGRNADFHFPAIDELFKDLTADAKLDYALARIPHTDRLSPELRDTLSKYIARNAADVCARLMKTDDIHMLALLEPCGVVKKTTLEDRLAQADKYKAVACKAWLLEWENRNVSLKEKSRKAENALKMRASTVAEIKKIWPHRKGADGGLIITGYNGKDENAVIPQVIGKTTVTAIGNSCFFESKDPEQQEFLRTRLRSVVIPDTVTSIEYMAFYKCGALEEVTLPKGLTELPASIFYGCEKLHLTLPEALTTMGKEALSGCPMEKLHLPAGVTDVTAEVFGGLLPQATRMQKLREFTVDPANKHYMTIDGVLFSADGTRLIRYPYARKEASYTIPEGVTTICAGAFCYSSDLRHLILPKSMKKVEPYAFAYCPCLEAIDFPKRIHLSNYAFRNCVSLKEITLPPGDPSLAIGIFQGCENLETVHLPGNLKRISSSAFDGCTSLKHIEIPESVRDLGDYAFRGCTLLTDLTFSVSCTRIDYSPFRDCPNLTIHTPSGSKMWLYAREQKIPVTSE